MRHEYMEDIKETIHAGAESREERRALQAVAEGLDKRLSEDVPFRPQFKAELRARLMAEARRSALPWYRRPAAWGSALGVVAAAAVLAIGLQMFDGQGPQTERLTQPEIAAAPQTVKTGETPVVPRLTNDLEIPVMLLPDEILAADDPGPESMAGLDLKSGLALYQEAGRVDERLFAELAGRLGFATRPPGRTATGFRLTQDARTLALTQDGLVVYSNLGADAMTGAETGGLEGARAVARSFLDRAALPVPDLQPAVSGVQGFFKVTYTPRVDGRPVINGRTVIQVNDRSAVTTAEAYVPRSLELRQRYEALSVEKARAAATERGGAIGFGAADLVWVRTPSGQAVYLQPYWRVFGMDSQGVRKARYVPALIR